MGGFLSMALAIPEAFGDDGWVFGIGYFLVNADGHLEPAYGLQIAGGLTVFLLGDTAFRRTLGIGTFASGRWPRWSRGRRCRSG